MPKYNELQRLILPDPEVCQELSLYAHRGSYASYSLRDRELRLEPKGWVSFASLFGAFSIGKWHRLTGLSSLTLRLEAQGQGDITIWNWRAGHGPRRLATAVLTGAGPVDIALPLDGEPDGIVAPIVSAHQHTRVLGGAWLTPAPPRRDVRVGVVITSFRREAAVRATVRRLTRGLLQEPTLAAAIVVVDNGRSLSPLDVPGATLIQNPNLGGSGGFTRGLAHLQDAGGFTHCVFMDDDASAEAESLRRAIQLLRYAKDPHTAVVSGLLYEERPGIQLESGGQMPGDAWIPARPGVDLRRIESLVENEQPFPLDYGGWWMFVFPLAGVRCLPFPFFLRGDDVEFPRANEFLLVTLNGVACFGPDFQRKESPINIALDRRGNLVNVLLYGSPQSARLAVLRGLHKGLMLANRYCYDHVDALIEGTRDVLAGPAGFEDLAGFAEGRRRDFAACVRQRRAALVEFPQYPSPTPRKWSWPWHLLRLALGNGHFLPRLLLVRPPVLLSPVWQAAETEVFLRPRVLIREGLGDQVIIADRDTRRYLGCLTRLSWISLKLLVGLPRLRKAFREARPRFGSRAYWDRQFLGAAPDNLLR